VLGSILHLPLVGCQHLCIDSDLRGSQSWGRNELKSRVPNELPGQPQERLFKVVVRFSRDIVVLKVLLAMEGYGLGFNLALLNVDLVSGKNDRNILTNTDEITVPVGNVLVGNSRSDVEHDDTALTVDVVSISQPTKLLLTSGIPNIELEFTKVGKKSKRVDLHTESGDIFFFELASQMTLDEGGLSGATIPDENELEGRNLSGHHGCICLNVCMWETLVRRAMKEPFVCESWELEVEVDERGG